MMTSILSILTKKDELLSEFELLKTKILGIIENLDSPEEAL